VSDDSHSSARVDGHHADLAWFPLVAQATFGHLRVEHADQARVVLRAGFARQQRVLWYMDTRRATRADALYRKQVASYADELESLGHKYSVCSVVVLDNPVLRAGLTAINWISRPVIPVHVVATPFEAAGMLERAWLADGGELTPPLREGLRRMRSDSLEFTPVTVPPADQV